MKEKYIEERWPYWFSMTVTKTDLSDDKEIEFSKCATPEDAKWACARHNAQVKAFTHMAQAWYNSDREAFLKYWYGEAL